MRDEEENEAGNGTKICSSDHFLNLKYNPKGTIEDNLESLFYLVGTIGVQTTKEHKDFIKSKFPENFED